MNKTIMAEFKRRQSQVHEIMEDMTVAQKRKWITYIAKGRQLVDTEENVRLKYELVK